MVDQLPTIGGDGGPVEATPVILFDAEGNEFGGADSPLIMAPVGITASASFTPAAGAYGAGDLISTPQEFVFTYADGTPIPAGSLIRVLSTVMKIDETSIISGETSYRLQAYSVIPPAVAFADNDAWTLKSTHLSAYRGPIELGTPLDLTESAYVKSQCVDAVTGLPGIDIKLTGTSMFGGLVTVGGFTATAIARQVLLYAMVI